MSSTHALLQQRAQGAVTLRMKASGIETLREQGSAKVRLPPGLTHAYLINTAGGLAGGDDFSNTFTIGEKTCLTITTQAAERVYRSLGPPARLHSQLTLAPHARLNWLPHETIAFDGASLNRRIAVEMDQTARFLGLEMLVFGREASGETITSLTLRDEWHIRRDGKLVHADIVAFNGALPSSKTTLGDAKALATLVLIDPHVATLAEKIIPMIGDLGGVSAWNGKLVARFFAKDTIKLKKAVTAVLSVLARAEELPKNWMV
ncbi:MAG: urease accessory protein UreD [Alphaproteobacteria bacterium]|nr:urease accessory protein UreD [Alphaproteobacteria bacterium]